MLGVGLVVHNSMSVAHRIEMVVVVGLDHKGCVEAVQLLDCG